MRLQVSGEDVYEVKRTHLSSKLKDVGTSFCDFIKSLCKNDATNFDWDDSLLNYNCVTFKSTDEKDIFEVLILTKTKEDAFGIIKEMFDTGKYNAINDYTVVITTEAWGRYLNM